MGNPPVPPPPPSVPISLDNIQAPTELPKPSPIVGEYTEIEEAYYKVQTRGAEQDIGERKKYAHRIFCLISAWLIAVFLLLVFQGSGGTPRHHFGLSDAVVLAVIGSTTVNVLGIFYIVTHYLFPKR